MLKKKLRGLKVTDAAKGTVQAVFATLNVIDLDGDVTLPGAFGDGEAVRISAYNHKSWEGALPVGKGTIREVGEEAILDGEFFLNTTAGRETFEVVKQMDELQEWSYGFDVISSEPGTFEGRTVNFLKRVKTHEVSPVILGAGMGTRTLSVKGKMTEQLEAKQLVSDLYDRLRSEGVERYGGTDTYVYIEDVDVDEGWVVYDVCSPTDERDMRVGFLRGADGSVSLADTDEEVEVATTYVPAGPEKGKDKEPETKGAEDPEPKPEDEPEEQGTKLADQLDATLVAVEEAATRVADAVAQRAENGQKLAEATLDRAEQLKSAIERLREALAIEPPPNNSDDEGWGEGLDIEDSLIRASAS